MEKTSRQLTLLLGVSVLLHIMLVLVLLVMPTRLLQPVGPAASSGISVILVAGDEPFPSKTVTGHQVVAQAPPSQEKIEPPTQQPVPEEIMPELEYRSDSPHTAEPVNPDNQVLLVRSIPMNSTGAGTITDNGNNNSDGVAVVLGGDVDGSGPGSVRPYYIRDPRPRYPAIARRKGWEGITVLRAEVHADGSVGFVEVLRSSGYHTLDEAAADAMGRAKFRPAHRDGMPITSWVEVPFNFKLNDG